MFTCQLGLLFSASLFDSSDTIKQLSSLTDESDDDDSDTEESELDFFKVIHQEDLLFPSSLCEVRMIKSAKFNSTNELACNQIDFKTPFSPPEIV
jgi:hypothetical protein